MTIDKTDRGKEMTKNCIQLPSENEFETAKQLITQRYGAPYRTTGVYGEEIKDASNQSW